MTADIYIGTRKVSVPQEILMTLKIKPGSRVTPETADLIQEEYFRIETRKRVVGRQVMSEKLST